MSNGLISKGFFLLLLAILLNMSHCSCPASPKGASYRIYAPFVLSPDGEELSFQVGSQQLGGEMSNIKPEPFVLSLRISTIPQVTPVIPKSLLPMAWRPSALPPELFGTIISSEPNTPNRLLAVAVADSTSVVLSRDLPTELSAWEMAWSADGKMLATRIRGPRNESRLGISYDGGKNLKVTNIVVSEAPVWIDDGTLCIQDANSILEVNIDNGNPYITRTIASGYDNPSGNFYFYMVGSLAGKVVYVLGDEVYCGNKLLYHSKLGISQILASSSHLGFIEGNHVIVLDNKGNVVDKRRIRRDTTKLIALSSANKYAYLMKNYQSIERYNFIENSEASTVYEVTNQNK